MKKTNVYQDLRIQFLYFFVAYELLKTTNLKLFLFLFLFILIDAIINIKNIIQSLRSLNNSTEVESSGKNYKRKLNVPLITLLLIWLGFISFILYNRQAFWLNFFNN